MVKNYEKRESFLVGRWYKRNSAEINRRYRKVRPLFLEEIKNYMLKNYKGYTQKVVNHEPKYWGERYYFYHWITGELRQGVFGDDKEMSYKDYENFNYFCPLPSKPENWFPDEDPELVNQLRENFKPFNTLENLLNNGYGVSLYIDKANNQIIKIPPLPNEDARFTEIFLTDMLLMLKYDIHSFEDFDKRFTAKWLLKWEDAPKSWKKYKKVKFEFQKYKNIYDKENIYDNWYLKELDNAK